MKYLKMFSLCCLIVFTLACSKRKEKKQGEELQKLQAQFSVFEKMANLEVCNDSTLWKITSYGMKACGGAEGYLAYSVQIDTALFFKRIMEYNQDQAAYVEKWGAYSDCYAGIQPKHVRCENGVAYMKY